MLPLRSTCIKRENNPKTTKLVCRNHANTMLEQETAPSGPLSNPPYQYICIQFNSRIYIHILTDKALYTDMTKLSYCSFGYSAHINNHHNIIVRIKEAYFLQASLSQAPYQMFNMQCHILFG